MKEVSKKQEGLALVSAIFVILIATVIGFALYHSSMTSLTIAVNDRDNTEALYIADAGINHAMALLGKVPKANYSAVLIAGANPVPNTGDELSQPPIPGLWASALSIPAGNASGGGVVNFGAGGGGRYWVSVKNDTAPGETPTVDVNGVLIVTSTGIGRDGATATVEATVQSGSIPPPAVLINGKAKISGSVKVSGSNGILHANDTLQIDGAPCAEQYFSSSVNIINENKLKGGGCIGAGFVRTSQPVIPPPIYNIRADFFGKTNYILGASGARAGKVYDGSGTMIADATKSSNKWVSGSAQWLWDPSKALWIQTGSVVLNASFYSEGNIAITGNFGTSTIPARVSFIAEGFIYNQGKQYLTPSYRNFTLVAGTDLLIAGKLTEVDQDDLEAEGITYAHHQVSFSGTPTIRGTVVAANQGDTNSPGCSCNIVPLEGGFMKISGNPTIISDGNNSSGGVTLRSWREIRY